MIGIGTDIIEIDRIRKAIKKEKFLSRFYAKEEIALFMEKKDMAPSAAANFAAKEAFSKALGTGVRSFYLKDIVILRDELGKPYVVDNQVMQAIKKQYGITCIFVTLSHSKTVAVATVVLE